MIHAVEKYKAWKEKQKRGQEFAILSSVIRKGLIEKVVFGGGERMNQKDSWNRAVKLQGRARTKALRQEGTWLTYS